MFKRGRGRSLSRASKTLFSIVVPLMPVIASAFLLRLSDPTSGDLGVGSSPLGWNGTATTFGSADESTCVEGVNCDTFTLNVQGQPADWSGKMIQIKINWTLQTNDYDLYVHKDSNAGMLIGVDGASVPSVEESVGIDPATTGTGVYTVHVVYFAGTPGVDQYRGTATVADAPINRRTGIYQKGGMSFSRNSTVRCPVAERDGEPSLRVDKIGNTYVAGIRGVPAGVDLWYFDLNPSSNKFDPFMRNPIYRGQPDSFTQDEALSVGADGGGDVDLAVSFKPNGTPIVAFTSLVATNISAAISTNLGVTWTLNPLGNVTGGVPADDRQWIEFYGENVVYLFYRTLAPAVSQIQRSNDGGLTWGPARTAGTIGQAGYIDVDQNDGTVYVSGSSGQVAVGIPPLPGLEPLTYTNYQAVSDPFGVDHLFVVVKVADDGTVYVAYSNDRDIFLTHSTDKGQTWALPVRVSNGAETRCSIMPWLETGPDPGSVGLVWYGTSATTPSDNSADWHAFYAVSYNAKSTTPTFRQAQITDHVIHGGNISEGGLLGDANRNLLDYFQLAFDPQGAAVIAYTDDHNDYDGFTYMARQITGPSIKGGHLGVQLEGSELPPPPSYGAEQVTDPAQDVALGLLGVVPANDPFDILLIKYTSQSVPATTAANLVGPVLKGTMKVSDLSIIPPSGTWRMCFTANVPAFDPNDDYAFGVSDRGEMFYMEANTDDQGVQTYRWGTAVRNPSGSISYTDRGVADGGSFTSSTGTIVVEVASAKLKPHLSKPLRVGSKLVGLRGAAFDTTSGIAKRDSTRGGRVWTIANGG